MKLTAIGDPAVDAELNRRVEASRPAPGPPEVLPEPTVPARPATKDDMARCGSARLAAKAAHTAGLPGSLTYSKGPLIAANGSLLEPDVESLVLRVRLPERRLVAVWLCRPSQPDKKTGKEKWALECAYVFPPVEKIGGNEIRGLMAA